MVLINCSTVLWALAGNQISIRKSIINLATTTFIMKFFVLLCGMLCTLAVPAQQRVVDVDKAGGSPVRGFFYTVAGEPVSTAKYVRVIEGTPFFSEEWMKGSALMADGNYYGYYPMRLDLVSGEVYFKNESGAEFIATKPINELFLADTILNREYHFVHSSAFVSAKAPGPGWYLLLYEGPQASLFKKLNKNIRETRPYGSATYEQTITTTPSYFLFYASSFHRVKKFSDIPDMLKDKSQPLRVFINKNRLTGKTDADFVVLLEHYQFLHRPE